MPIFARTAYLMQLGRERFYPSFFFNLSSLSAINLRISSPLCKRRSHCSLYKVTGKRPKPYTETAPFSLTLIDIAPFAGRPVFSASFSALSRSSSACKSSLLIGLLPS